MEDSVTMYRMYMLMNYPEIDAFAAQKNAGSKNAYFNLLSDFARSVPGLLEKVSKKVNRSNKDAYLGAIDDLQSHLLAVGASELMWEAEKVVELAKSGDTKTCENMAFTLAAKVRALCLHIENSKFGVEKPATLSARKDAVLPELEKRFKAPIKLETFEKLSLLIENFEMDAAMEMLQAMVNFSYNDTIDKSLLAVYTNLSEYDYDASADGMEKVLEMVKKAKKKPSKNEKKRILAIDDVPDVLNTVKAVLKSSYDVYGVTSHMTALKFLTNNSADLILLDIEMPDMNGFALLGIIRKMKAYADTPVVFLTGNASIENIKKSVEIGGNDFIRKPVDVQILLEKIEKHLEC